MPTLSPRLRNLLMVVLVAVVAGTIYLTQEGTSPPPGAAGSSVLAVVQVGALPAQARDTLALIEKGGPFPFPRNDGVVFENREGLLPDRPSGYYREYTVITPGSPDRGARRIITGGGEFYYTADHYRSFRRIEGVT